MLYNVGIIKGEISVEDLEVVTFVSGKFPHHRSYKLELQLPGMRLELVDFADPHTLQQFWNFFISKNESRVELSNRIYRTDRWPHPDTRDREKFNLILSTLPSVSEKAANEIYTECHTTHYGWGIKDTCYFEVGPDWKPEDGQKFGPVVKEYQTAVDKEHCWVVARLSQDEDIVNEWGHHEPKRIDGV